jgi:hypothetical protein
MPAALKKGDKCPCVTEFDEVSEGCPVCKETGTVKHTSKKALASLGGAVETPVTRYVVWVSVPGINAVGLFDGGNGVCNYAVDETGKPIRRRKGRHISAIEQFNMSWGFEDGDCNEWVDNKIVAKAHRPEGFEEAQRGLHAGLRVRVLVSVYRDGRRECKIL